VVIISPTTSLLWPQLLYPRITTVIDPTYPYTDDQTATLLLGRYAPNAYIVTAHGQFPDIPAYEEIVSQRFAPHYSDDRFDIYRLTGG
jgi:hypothetical protein